MQRSVVSGSSRGFSSAWSSCRSLAHRSCRHLVFFCSRRFFLVFVLQFLVFFFQGVWWFLKRACVERGVGAAYGSVRVVAQVQQRLVHPSLSCRQILPVVALFAYFRTFSVVWETYAGLVRLEVGGLSRDIEGRDVHQSSYTGLCPQQELLV